MLNTPSKSGMMISLSPMKSTSLSRLNKETFSSQMKKNFQVNSNKAVKFQSQDPLSAKKTTSFGTGRLSNTPSKYPSSFMINIGSGKIKENSVPATKQPLSTKPFSIPMAGPVMGRRSILGEQSNNTLATVPTLGRQSLPALQNIENPHLTTQNLNKIEMFKNSNFSLIELMKKSKNDDNRSETMSIRYNNASQISTPRLTPLKMIDRNRNQLVSQDDIDKLEFKIKEIEDQIFAAKKKGEDKKIDKLETQLKKTENQHINLLLKEDVCMEPVVIPNKAPSPLDQQESDESDFDIDIEYDCSSLTLEQSMKQVFNIINSVKIPSIEK